MEGVRGPRKFNERMISFLYWVRFEQENFIGKSYCSTVVRTNEKTKRTPEHNKKLKQCTRTEYKLINKCTVLLVLS